MLLALADGFMHPLALGDVLDHGQREKKTLPAYRGPRIASY
jgi:hypothetical protein